jgi:HSP20 family protein
MRFNATSDPVRFFGDLTSDVNTLVDSLFGENGMAQKVVRWTPSVDVIESEKEFRIDMDLPGVAAENVDVHLSEDGLMISGKREAASSDEKAQVHRRERYMGEFKRVIRLPELVDRDNIQAEYVHGVLRVTVAKIAKPEPKKIMINTVA